MKGGTMDTEKYLFVHGGPEEAYVTDSQVKGKRMRAAKIVFVLWLVFTFAQLACGLVGPGTSPMVELKPGCYGVSTRDWRDVYNTDGARQILHLTQPVQGYAIERKGVALLVYLPHPHDFFVVAVCDLIGDCQWREIR